MGPNNKGFIVSLFCLCHGYSNYSLYCTLQGALEEPWCGPLSRGSLVQTWDCETQSWL